MVRYDEKLWNVMRCDEIWWDTIYILHDDKIQYDMIRFYKIILPMIISDIIWSDTKIYDKMLL